MELLELHVWWPWWCLRPAPGWGSQLVLVGCHLDSTAASDGGFNPSADPAPGADDDASGIALALAAARRLWAHRDTLTHTVRFAFFNAEEVGRVGSGAYAAMLKASNAPVKAVVCADMVGYNSDLNQIFEIHAGATNAAVRDLSVPIAQKIAAVAGAQGNLGSAQLYQGTAWPPPGNTDRSLYDGAIDRSDHASFHAQGYPAVVVSEDFFANLASEPASDPNPNYHRAADQVIDATYGARIACAVSEAVRQIAK
jgi:Zn-dependent M28 family amino/carboxypeptidase